MNKGELFRAEDAAWEEIHPLVHRLTPEQISEVGYQDDWSVKDLLAHLGCWAAEGAQSLRRIRMGTYEPEELDIEAMNREFWEACRNLDVDGAMAQLHSGRARLLEALEALPEDLLDGEAEDWFAKNAHEHYAEHLPRLREWAAKLTQ